MIRSPSFFLLLFLFFFPLVNCFYLSRANKDASTSLFSLSSSSSSSSSPSAASNSAPLPAPLTAGDVLRRQQQQQQQQEQQDVGKILTKRSCSCGSVQLFINSEVLQTVHCHCEGCRRATGAAFSTWGCVPLVSTWFQKWSTLRVHQRIDTGITTSSPRANRYFCSKCGCSVAMTYPATGRWPEPNSLWLSAAFLPTKLKEDAVIHMYPEERPNWCTIDKAGCTGESLTYMGGEHMCVVRDDDFDDDNKSAALMLGGRAGQPMQDPAASIDDHKEYFLPPTQSFRLRGLAPAPQELPGSTVFPMKHPPQWLNMKDGDGDAEKEEPVTTTTTTTDIDFRIRTVEVEIPLVLKAAAGQGGGSSGTRIRHHRHKLPVSVFEVADPMGEDGCDPDSPRSSFCGGVIWPGSQGAAEALARIASESSTTTTGAAENNDDNKNKSPPSAQLLHHVLAGKRVLEIGAGTGLVSLVAALMGAKEVIATDASIATLELIEAAAAAQDLTGIVRTRILDVIVDNDDDDDPDDEYDAEPNNNKDNDDDVNSFVDYAIAADLLYSEELARGIARMCAELKRKGTTIIVTDSQTRYREVFLEELRDRLFSSTTNEHDPNVVANGASSSSSFEFESIVLKGYTGWSYPEGSDVTVDEIPVGVFIL